MAKKASNKKSSVSSNKGVNKEEMLDKLVKELEKNYGQGSIMILGKGLEDERKLDIVPTGVLSVDIALGVGGYPRGRIIEIYGNESSGKTTLALHSIAEVQRRGGIAAFIDAEHALDLEYAKKLGVDPNTLILSQPDFGEQALEIVDSIVRSNIVDLVVIDSVAALVPRAEIEGNMGDSHVGLQARLMSQALRKLAGSVNKSKTIVIFINQTRMKIGVAYGNPETTAGGVALKFYSTIRMEVRKGTTLREGKDAYGNEVNIKVVKNKVAPPFKEAKVDMIYGQGLAKINDIFNIAVNHDIVKRSGAWFSYTDLNGNEISLGQGKIKSLDYLKENSYLLDEIEYRIRKEMDLPIPDDLKEKVENPSNTLEEAEGEEITNNEEKED
ncbi:recombinase RecA [Marinitoga sp. 1135]|uniref:Protein RecA n=1 Tax=Marinitoga piezophila (strain DSM 14283 / JCM 11233 / KA3) TaxID=443254 RepID=H2J3E9_MARPK|nr:MULTISPECIES: recombinase RecA [Marinitoga]AEX85765.1 protein RecA [Marinitoga piezophila KA3]NUU95967.1 recombinase RecA [Marinitoga sp. 1135]NUU97879.1 recombinase RecA [Marinitoga sp. 1138]